MNKHLRIDRRQSGIRPSESPMKLLKNEKKIEKDKRGGSRIQKIVAVHSFLGGEECTVRTQEGTSPGGHSSMDIGILSARVTDFPLVIRI